MFGPIWYVLSHSYTGEFSASGVQRALDEIPSRETTNLSASWWSEDGNFSVRAFVNNLFDEENYYSLGTSSDEQNFRKTVSPLSPRIYGVDLRYKF
jgi:outer membrane receptor protein involved in Fe transport